ncbi:MAG: hypothetical protein P4L40_13135 [Terracidiphilus sp.]|nr:hypothetical protein [Terracidiphilus sp.]
MCPSSLPPSPSPPLRSNNTKYDQYSQSDPWTLRAYTAASPLQRFMYRAVYSPFAFLVVMPFITFIVLFSYKAKWYENALSAAYLYWCVLSPSCFRILLWLLVAPSHSAVWVVRYYLRRMSVLCCSHAVFV